MSNDSKTESTRTEMGPPSTRSNKPPIGPRSVTTRSVGSTVSIYRTMKAAQLVEKYTPKIKSNDTLSSDKATLCTKIGLAYHKEKNYSAAIQYFQTALSHSTQASEKIQLRNKIGTIYLEQSEFALANEIFATVLNTIAPDNNDPDYAKTLSYLGLSFKGLKDYPAATDYCTKALTAFDVLKDKDNSANMHFHLGTIHSAQDNHLAAHAEFLLALQDYGKDAYTAERANVLFHLGLNECARNDYNAAVFSFSLALAVYNSLDNVNIELAQVQYQLGYVYFTLDDIPSARQNFSKALKIHGNNSKHIDVAHISFYSGLISHRQKNYKDALENLDYAKTKYLVSNTAGEYDSKLAAISDHIGQICQAQSHNSAAQASYRSALTMYLKIASTPKSTIAAIHRHLGEIYLAENLLDEARKSLTAALEIYKTLPQQENEVSEIQDLLDQAQITVATSPKKTSTIENNNDALNKEFIASPRKSEAKERSGIYAWLFNGGIFSSAESKKSRGNSVMLFGSISISLAFATYFIINKYNLAPQIKKFITDNIGELNLNIPRLKL